MNSQLTAVVCALILAAGTVLKPEPAHAQWWNPFEPKTFEDCVLENLQGAPNDAKHVIYAMCLEKFPPKDGCATRDATAEELKTLNAWMRVDGEWPSKLHGALFNKSTSVEFSEVTIKVPKLPTGNSQPLEYKILLSPPIAPGTSRPVTTNLRSNLAMDHFSFEFISARACR